VTDRLHNSVNGPVTGNVVQANEIHGGVNFYAPERGASASNRRIRDALAHVIIRLPDGTGVFVAPGLVLSTTATGSALVPLGDDKNRYALLSASVDPDDELVALYHPSTTAHPTEIRWIELRSADTEDALQVMRGAPSPGYLGAPVLNWRTGAVCGVLGPSDPTQPRQLSLVPISAVLKAFNQLAEWHGKRTLNVGWLNLLDDEQLRSGGWRYPNRTLRRYLADAAQADTKHPYAELLSHAPPLHEVYLTQQARRSPDTDDQLPEAVPVDQILREYPQVQVVGGPGAGKSSLVRHIIGSCARQWLDDGVGEFVAVTVSAEALTAHAKLPDKLANGAGKDLLSQVGRDELVAMFGRAPIPDVPWLILVDGLDEITQWQRPGAWRAIADHRGHSGQYRFLVTTRPLGDLPGLATEYHYPSFVIERFDEAARETFAVRWFGTVRRIAKQDAATTAAAFIKQVNRGLPPDLVGIPLILTMLCILYDEYPAEALPRNQAELYQKFVTWLRGKLHTDDLVGALDELVRNRGTPALDAVARLGNQLDQLLEWSAYQRQQHTAGHDRNGSSLLQYAAGWPVCRPAPDVLPTSEWTNAVTEALRACGLVVESNGEFVFLHRTVQEYLAASYLDRTRKRRPFAARREFAPQNEWPWPDLQVKLFLAAMWSSRMHRPLRRLLKRRHRTKNVGFVVQLTRYGLTLGFDIESMAKATLRALIHDQQPGMLDWQQYIGWLRQLDERAAVTTLREVLDDPRVPETHLFEAMRQLAELDRTDAFTRIAAFIHASDNSGEVRLRMARLVAAVDIEEGMASFAQLTRSVGIGHLRLEAALWVADHDVARGVKLLIAIRDDHEAEDALRISAAIAHARREPQTGIAGLVMLGRDGSLQWANRHRYLSDVTALDQTAAADIYAALVHDRSAPVLERIRLLWDLPTEFGRLPWFSDLARNPAEDIELRMAVTWLLASYDVSTAAAVLREILDAPRADSLARATTAQLLDVLSRSIVEPVDLAEEIDRLDVASAVFRVTGSSTALPLFIAVAEDAEESSESRLAAVSAVTDIDDAVARRLYIELAQDPKIDYHHRLEVAETVADRYGRKVAKPLFLALAQAGDVSFDVRMRSIKHLPFELRADLYVALSEVGGVSVHNRLDAAKAALKINASRGSAALTRLAESAGGFALRMEVIRNIPGPYDRARLYGKLAAIRGYRDGDRLTAAKKAADAGSMEPLQKLANDRSVGRVARDAAKAEVDKRWGIKR
jgi:hypothetical protein